MPFPTVPVVRHTCSEYECRHEIKERGPENGLDRRQHSSRHDGRNGVRRVMEAIENVEQERKRDQKENHMEGRDHRSLMHS